MSSHEEQAFMPYYFLSPSLVLSPFSPGPDYVKQRFQEGVDAKENPEEKVPEKPPTPKESPHFYRKGTTPPASPEASPKQGGSPSPKPVKKQNPSSGARLNQDKRSAAEEQVTATVNKPLTSKAPTKEVGAAVPHSRYSGRHHVPNPSNGELHSQYHGYYVKLNAPQYPPEDVEEEEGPSQSSSALVHKPSPNRWSPPKSVTKPVAKESKAEPKAKKSELAIPKNPASNDSCPALEKEANSVSRARRVFLSLLLLLVPSGGSVGHLRLDDDDLHLRLAKVPGSTGLCRVEPSPGSLSQSGFSGRNSSVLTRPTLRLHAGRLT